MRDRRPTQTQPVSLSVSLTLACDAIGLLRPSPRGRRRFYPPLVRRVLVDRGHEVAVQRVAEAALVVLGVELGVGVRVGVGVGSG